MGSLWADLSKASPLYISDSMTLTGVDDDDDDDDTGGGGDDDDGGGGEDDNDNDDDDDDDDSDDDCKLVDRSVCIYKSCSRRNQCCQKGNKKK